MSNMNNQNDDRRIVEESPTMRSVSMMPSMAPPIPLRGATMYSPKQAFRSPEGALRPLTVETKVAPTPIVVDASPWKVTAALAIPSYYPLERTHVCVPDASSLEVSKRISDCFFHQSIAATFDNQEVCNNGASASLSFPFLSGRSHGMEHDLTCTGDCTSRNERLSQVCGSSVGICWSNYR
jgi:hypothetical protein